MNDDNPDREQPTEPPPAAPVEAIEAEAPVEAIEAEPIEARPEEPMAEPLPHELDPNYVYDTAEWPEGDYNGEPHPWQITTR